VTRGGQRKAETNLGSAGLTARATDYKRKAMLGDDSPVL